MNKSYQVNDVDKSDLVEIIKIQTEVVQEGINLSMIMFLVANRAQEITHSDGAVIELKENDNIVYRATSGIANAALGLRLKSQGSLSGLCIRQGQSLICDDAENDPRVDKDACRKVGLSSMLVTPLNHNGELIGVLKVVSKSIGHYDNKKMQILELLSELISAAMYIAGRYGQEALFIKATTDEMTGIKNRSMFYELLRARLSKAERLQEKFGIILFDMDNLKTLNDTYGHKMGDAGMLEVVERVRHVLRESDTLCRLGGDEFGIITEAINTDQDICMLINRIKQNVNRAFVAENTTLGLSISIGFSIYEQDEIDLKKLIDIADMRVYQDKRTKKAQQTSANLVSLPS